MFKQIHFFVVVVVVRPGSVSIYTELVSEKFCPPLDYHHSVFFMLLGCQSGAYSQQHSFYNVKSLRKTHKSCKRLKAVRSHMRKLAEAFGVVRCVHAYKLLIAVSVNRP